MISDRKAIELYRGGSDGPVSGEGFNYSIHLIRFLKLNVTPPGIKPHNIAATDMLKNNILGQRFYTDDFSAMI